MSAEVDDDEVDDDSGPSVAEAAEELAKKKKEDNDRELKEAQDLEAKRQREREAEVAASWKKKVVVQGTGREAYAGAQCRVHVVGRAHVDKRVGTTRDFVNGSVFEDSRARQCPLLLLLGRGILVPGLDKALLSMRAGERATITIAPEGGYGGGGSISNPVVPGSATLTYDVEVLSIEKEEELWDLSFEDKMRYAAERRQRGNTLTGGKYYLMAAEEYEQGLRYLVFMPHPEPQQVPHIQEASAACHLNLAAVNLRMGREKTAIKHAEDCLKLRPDDAKAHYRLGQAYNQLGDYQRATKHLTLAEKHAAGDAGSVAAIAKERERLQRRQEKHQRDRKKALSRMGTGGAEEEGVARGAWMARLSDAGAARWALAATLTAVVAGAVAWAIGQQQQQQQ